jgi:uncharacterized protein
MPEIPPPLSRDLPPNATMTLDGEFTFRCGQDLDCFTQCCRDVSIVLTPYDVLRMKRSLHLNSSEFLNKFTITLTHPKTQLPIVILRMGSETLRCPFVTGQGCSIYADRPWACRMYPLGVAEPRRPAPGQTKLYWLIQEEHCHGHGPGKPCGVSSWLASQGLEVYEMMESSFTRLMLSEFWEKADSLPPEKLQMYFMACYDQDRFRRFVFQSSFLKRFDVDEARVEAIREDDEELLELAMEWLRFSMFGEKTMRLRQPSEGEEPGQRGRACCGHADCGCEKVSLRCPGLG